MERGEVDAVEEYLRGTIGPDNPDAPIVLEALARGYFMTDRLADLLECSELWLQIRPEETHALFWRGRAWGSSGRSFDAIDAYQQAIKADPENAEARLHLALLLLNHQQAPAEALIHFEYLHQRRPSDPAAALGWPSVTNSSTTATRCATFWTLCWLSIRMMRRRWRSAAGWRWPTMT